MKPLPFDKPCACGCGGMATVRYVRGHAPKSPSFIAQTERTDPVPRFWAKVDKSGKCWLWTGSTNRRGYGSFRVHHGIPSLAHRYAYELEIGPVPDGKFVCHSCDTPA